jgi:hypothetical protein
MMHRAVYNVNYDQVFLARGKTGTTTYHLAKSDMTLGRASQYNARNRRIIISFHEELTHA